MTTKLFSTLKLRNLEFRNRIFVSPMCQYSATDGVPNDWHFVHLGSRAVGGASLVIAEATAVIPEGRISQGDLGIWNDEHLKAFRRITSFISAQGALPGIQLAHAGRKASMPLQWVEQKVLNADQGGWQTVAPSPIPFDEGYSIPHELSKTEISEIVRKFSEAAHRSLAAGFKVIEIHMAHGYLLHEFLSPLSNRRKDEFGGSLECRMRFPLQVAQAIRTIWPSDLPAFVRISATDWAEGGWDLQQSIEFARQLKAIGIDLIDCSSGGNIRGVKTPVAPGYQVPFASAIRKETGIPTGAVGLITEPRQAEEILQRGEADAIVMARAFLKDPYWPLHAAQELSADTPWPIQYVRAKPRK
jgi:2,4-dienoyl-CoA reductase-like NADH-dependent reductase (Old Yellow Enzyme family)